MKKQPEVTARTRKKLIDAFWNIYCENGIHRTTVGAITKAAGFNRGTFYEYFTDIYDLLGQLEDELIQTLRIEIEQLFHGRSPENLQDFSRICIHIFSRYGDQLYMLMSPQGDPAFSVKLQRSLQPIFLSITGLTTDEPHLDYLTAFGFSAMLGLVGHWYEKGKDLEIEELVPLIQSLVASGVFGYARQTPLYRT